jgi:hypothetical protein
MTPEDENPSPSSGDRGVFGNLPSERPGVRSPRRTGEDGSSSAKPKQAKASAAKPSSTARPSARTSPRPRPPEPSAGGPAAERARPRPSSPPEPEADPSRKGIEEVAWAGVTVAAEAATLGVRLFSRALEAVRERR